MPELGRTDDQEELAELLAGLLARHSDSAAVRAAVSSPDGCDDKLWRLLCEQVGVAGLTVSEEHAGAGGSFADTAVVLEELGYALTPSPLLATTLAIDLLRRSGDSAACTRLLPDLATGEATATLVWSGPTGLAGAPEPVIANGERLTGQVDLVLDGDTADVLLVAAWAGDGLSVHEVQPDADGLRREHRPAMDLTLRTARVTLDDVQAVRLTDEDLADSLAATHAVACASVAALSAGVARRALDMTVAHTRQRHQFGRPIGSFQALKHRMADMLVLVETARSAALDAALAVATDADDLVARTSVAKAWCADALDQLAAEMVQLHGGIAITWEHDAHLVLKRAHALGRLFGAAHQHRAALPLP